MKGFLSLVLHAHLPFVRHPEHEEFLEEDWFYEAVFESYLPLLSVFEELKSRTVPFRITLSLTPTLLSMLGDPLLIGRCRKRLDRLCQLADLELERTRRDTFFAPLSRYYQEHFARLRSVFSERYRGDLVSAFRALEESGQVEIITSAATHAFLPLMQNTPEAVRAQIALGVSHHRRVFGRPPRGIWLPECGYYHGLEQLLVDEGLAYFFVDAHGLANAVPRPLYGPYAPVVTPSGAVAFARDPETSRRVWSREVGYPGHADYREFYRDIGWDLGAEYMRPFIQPTGERKATGIKYFRITGKTDDKQPYQPHQALERARFDARDFCQKLILQLDGLSEKMEGRPPVVVAPFDAELFGHWWFEGPSFLKSVIEQLASVQSLCAMVSPTDYLARCPRTQLSTPSASSWGERGYAQVWLDEANDWIYRPLYACSKQMVELANEFKDANPLQKRVLAQAARELLLAQSSDWAFIMRTGTMVDYAVQRTQKHLVRFSRLTKQLRSDRVDQSWLSQLEGQDNLFPELDYRAFASR